MKHLYILLISSFIIAQDEYLVTIPATSYSDWVYYSFESNSIVPIDYPETSLDWDVAFQRKHIKTNSGLSGPGNGGAFVDSVAYLEVGYYMWTDEWSNINTIEDYPYEVTWLVDTMHNDFYDLQTHTFVEGVKNPALNSWGWFDDAYVLNPTDYVMFLRLANGEDVVKFWAYDYYQNGFGGNVSLRYQTGLFDSFCPYDFGDVNADEIVNIVDVVMIVNSVLYGNDFDECQISVSDFNLDGIINVIDIIAIVNLILEN